MATDSQNVVNEVFWANYAAEKIYASFDIRAKAVENLQSFIKWVFTLFSGGGLILSFFGKGELDVTVLVLLGLGFVALLIAYFFATESGLPVTEEINPNEASSIQRAFAAAIKKSNTHFKQANYCAIMGTFIIAIGILIQFSSAKSPVLKTALIPPKLEVNAYLEKGKDTVVPFVVNSEKNADVTIRISGSDSLLGNQPYPQKDTQLFYMNLKTDTAGLYFGNYAIPKNWKMKYLFITAIANKSNPDEKYNLSVKKITLKN